MKAYPKAGWESELGCCSRNQLENRDELKYLDYRVFSRWGCEFSGPFTLFPFEKSHISGLRKVFLHRGPHDRQDFASGCIMQGCT